MELYVLRHGPAEDRDPMRWPDDANRPLTREGVRETQRAARGLSKILGPVDRVASSPASRAHATAQILAGELAGEPSVDSWDEAEPGRPPAPLLARVARGKAASRKIVIVGHEPTLGELVGLAVTGEPSSIVRLTKAGAAMIEFPRSVVPGGGTLGWLLTRKQLMGWRS